MSYVARLSALAFITFALGAPHISIAQRRNASRSFQGRWVWAVYARESSELPPGYRGMKVKDVPWHTLELDLKQRGRRLAGEYVAGARFLAKIESGDFTTTANINAARVELGSGHGGKITARITLRGGRLYWKIIKAEGEYYFPDEVVLRRVKKKPSAP